ncbi:hypothetical protein Scep_004361 [Stephania cephalantha]|uniref:tRNA/rRNA methyltransferase SpoU type domain-containing protein n=1 Tax=Stephania cephalantha TaxID=152367 RepID=A0AAP0KU47_9MAGN
MDSTGLKTLSLSLIVSPLYRLRCRGHPCVPPFRSSELKKIPPRLSLSCQRFSASTEGRELESLVRNAGEAGNGSSKKSSLQVVLVSPQIPGNTGTIARTCAASAVGLHLIEPLGFLVDDTKLKRAGLDYWPYVVVEIHRSWADFKDYFIQQEGEKRLLAFTKRGTLIHSDFSYRRGDWLVFGSETSGLRPEILSDCNNESFGGGTMRIPMVEKYVRCLNLSVSVGIAVYEASRQLNYELIQLESESLLH